MQNHAPPRERRCPVQRKGPARKGTADSRRSADSLVRALICPSFPERADTAVRAPSTRFLNRPCRKRSNAQGFWAFCLLLAALGAQAQPANNNFANAIPLTGLFVTT